MRRAGGGRARQALDGRVVPKFPRSTESCSASGQSERVLPKTGSPNARGPGQGAGLAYDKDSLLPGKVQA